MSFIRYKKFGQKEYAYEVKAYWDAKQKKPRQKLKYLGKVVNKEKQIFRKKSSLKEEQLILDFGDTYAIYELAKSEGFVDLLKANFNKYFDIIFSLICYRLSKYTVMSYAKIWYEGNVASKLFTKAKITSQQISSFLKFLGKENVQRAFFKSYIKEITEKKTGIIIDATSLPNQINFPLNAWGYNDGNIDKQIRSLIVIDQKSQMPLFLRYLSGNITDVSALEQTLEVINKLGITAKYAILDAGFFSKDNIQRFYQLNIAFTIRLPASRSLYKELIDKEVKTIEHMKYAVKYGKRALFVKEKKINLFDNKAYAYIVLDPERKGREIKNLILEALEDNKEQAEINFSFKKRGIMIVISSFKIPKEEVVPQYYMRQTIEQLIGFSKEDLNLLPLRIHSEATLRGYLLLVFIALAIFIKLRKRLDKKYTVKEALMHLRNIKCKIYDKEMLIQELTKNQKELASQLEVIMPKKMGI